MPDYIPEVSANVPHNVPAPPFWHWSAFQFFGPNTLLTERVVIADLGGTVTVASTAPLEHGQLVYYQAGGDSCGD